MYENQINNLIDNLNLNECLAVLAICAPDVLKTVYDDLTNNPDKFAAVLRARAIVNDVRIAQKEQDLGK